MKSIYLKTTLSLMFLLATMNISLAEDAPLPLCQCGITVQDQSQEINEALEKKNSLGVHGNRSLKFNRHFTSMNTVNSVRLAANGKSCYVTLCNRKTTFTGLFSHAQTGSEEANRILKNYQGKDLTYISQFDKGVAPLCQMWKPIGKKHLQVALPRSFNVNPDGDYIGSKKISHRAKGIEIKCAQLVLEGQQKSL